MPRCSALGTSHPGGTEGFALAVVVVLLLAGALLAHASLALARLEFRVSVAFGDVVQARLAAQAAATSSLAAASGFSHDGTPVGLAVDSVVGSRGSTRFSGRLRRVSPEIWLAEGDGESRTGSAAVARVAWALDPQTRADDWPAALVVGGALELLDGAVVSERIDRTPEVLPPGGCEDPVDVPVLSRPPSGRPPWILDTVPSWAPFGQIGVESVSALLSDSLLSGSGTPQPDVAFGVCLAENVWNWGDPGGARPCDDHMVGVVAPESLLVSGGSGQGLLVLEKGGALTDVDFFGVVVAMGDLVLSGSTRITGLVYAAAGITVTSGARIEGSACWASAALQDPVLFVPILLDGPGWIRLYG